MNAFEHTIQLMKMHRPLGEREAVFMGTPALNALPSRTYIDGRLVKTNGAISPGAGWKLSERARAFDSL